MWKERHRHGVPATPRSSRRPPQSAHRSGVVLPPGVSIIPGNRFFLLPLKKVTALVRPHTPCREPSATSTKPCIITKGAPAATPSSRSGPAAIQAAAGNVAVLHNEKLQYSRQAHSRRLIVKHRHRLYPAIAKTRLSPVFEQAQAERESLLTPEYRAPDDQENWQLWNDQEKISARLLGDRTPISKITSSSTTEWQQQHRSKNVSVFSLNEPPSQLRLESCRLLRASQASSLGGSTPKQVVSNLNMDHIRMAKKKKKKLSSSNIDLIRYRISSRRISLAKTRFSTERDHILNSDHDSRDIDMISDHNSTSLQPCKIGGRVGRTFGRNNCRVSPSSFGKSTLQGNDQLFVTPWKRRNRNNVGCSGAAVSHQIRSSSPFLCSFTDENDLPIGPAPLQLRRKATHGAGAQVD